MPRIFLAFFVCCQMKASMNFSKIDFFIFYQSIAEMTLLVIFPDVWLFLLFINKVIWSLLKNWCFQLISLSVFLTTRLNSSWLSSLRTKLYAIWSSCTRRGFSTMSRWRVTSTCILRKKWRNCLPTILKFLRRRRRDR